MLLHGVASVATYLAVDLGVALPAEGHEAVESAVEGEAAHFVGGAGGFDGDDVVDTRRGANVTAWHSCLDAQLAATLTKRCGAEFQGAEFSPLTAVVDGGFVLRLLGCAASPGEAFRFVHIIHLLMS